MEYIINARVSNRHVHITKEMYDLLFDEEITKKYDLNQIGEFASNQTLTIKNGDKEIKNVRLINKHIAFIGKSAVYTISVTNWHGCNNAWSI